MVKRIITCFLTILLYLSLFTHMPTFASVTDDNPYNVALGKTITDVNNVKANSNPVSNLVNGDSVDSGAVFTISSGKVDKAVLEINLEGTYSVCGVDLLSPTNVYGGDTNDNYTLKKYQVHYWSNNEWKPVKIAAGTSASVKSGFNVESINIADDGCTVITKYGLNYIVFENNVTTSKIRLVSKEENGYAKQLREIRVYKSDGNNVALRKPVTTSYANTGGGTNKDKVIQMPAFIVDGQSNNRNAQEYTFRGDASTAACDHWVEIDLLKDYNINRAIVSTGVTRNFKLQAYKNGKWVDIPGATAENNTVADRELIFPEYTANKVRLFLPAGQNQKIKEIKLYSTDTVIIDEMEYTSNGKTLKWLVPDTTVVGNMKLTNISDSSKKATYISALYKKANGKEVLRDIRSDSCEIPAGMSENLSINMTLPSNIDDFIIKTFLFDSPDNIMPYYGTEKFPVLKKPTLDDLFETETVTKINNIMENISGAEEFTVAEPYDNQISVSVADFGASPLALPKDNVKAFDKAIAKVKELNASKLIIPNGIYYLGEERKTQISFVGISDLLVDGMGSELIFTEHKTASSGEFIYIEDCNRIKMKNLTFDWDFENSPTIFIGEVSSVDFDTNTVEFIAEGVNIPDNFTFGGGGEWDTKVNNKVPEEKYKFPSGDSVVSVAKTDLNKFSVTYTNSNAFKEAKVGSPVFLQMKPNYNANGIRTYKSKDVIFSDVTMHTVPYVAFDTSATENLEFNGVKVIPRKGRRFSGYGGLETHRIYRNVKLINSTLDGIFDDIFHLSNSFLGAGAIKQDAHTVIFDRLQLFAHNDLIYKGAKMIMKTSEFEEIDWQSEITDFEWQLNYYPGASAAHRCVVKFKDPLPEDFKDTNLFFCTDFKGNYIVKNNVLKNGSCHAFYFGMGNGTIENNTIENIAYPAFALHNVLRWGKWTIGDNPTNVIIRENKIKGSNYAQRDPASFFIGGGYDEQPSNYTEVKGYVAQNILMENNIIEDSAWAGFGMFSAKNVIVLNNKFINSNFRKSREKYEGMGNAYIYNAKDIVFAGNIIENTIDTYENGIFIDSDTTQNVISDNNSGFGDTITK